MRRAAIVHITNKTRGRISSRHLAAVARRVLAALGLSGEFEIVCAPPGLMRRLNARYRRKRDVAEVLAFRYPGGTPRGQIFILHRPGTNDPATRARLLVHAMVHLKGYDHRTRHARARMEQEEARVLRYLSRQRRQHSTQTV